MLDETTIKKIQRRLLEMAVNVHEILEENNISYIITYGTLLGAVRHKGFIPWDDDFDIYIFDDQYDKAIECLRISLPARMVVQDEINEPQYFHSWAHVKDLSSIVHCDLFPGDNTYTLKGFSIDLYRTKRVPANELHIFKYRENIRYYNKKHKLNLISNKEYIRIVYRLRFKLFIERTRNIFRKRERELWALLLPGRFMLDEEVFPLKKYPFENHEFWGPYDYNAFLERCYGDYLILPKKSERKPHYTQCTFVE